MRVGVIGGGVVGLCCALELQRRGARVTLVERGRCGGGASSGNAGWITPGFSAPLAAPGTVRRTLRRTLAPGSPFRVRPRLDADLLRWGRSFARSCTPERYRAGMQALVRLNAPTFDLFDRLAGSGVQFELQQTGILFLARTRSGLEEYAATLDELAANGYAGAVERLDGDEVRAREPAVGAGVTSGIYAPLERHVRPETLVEGLARAFRDAGGEIREQTAVVRLAPAEGSWTVRTAADESRLDRVVVAAGAWTGELVEPLGARVPLEGAKGYSITARVAGAVPTHALYLAEAKVACSPFGRAVRLAGTLELAGLDLRLRRRRLDAIERAARRYLADWRPAGAPAEWCGLRPLAPDGLPVIGELPRLRGLFVATGHGMLGVTLAPATAALLAPLVLGEGEANDVLLPFAPDRFAE